VSVLRCSQHLQRCDDTERAVETTSVWDRVEVRAEEERRRFGDGRAENGRVVAGRVNSGLETGRGGSVDKPGAGCEMSIAEGWPVHTALGGEADRS